MNDFFKPRFVNRYLTSFQLFDFFGVVIDTDNVVPHVGETSARHQPNVSGADNRDIHQSTTLRVNEPQHKCWNTARLAVPIYAAVDQSPCDVGSKFKSKPNFGNALSVTVNRRPYSFTPALSRITPPNEAPQLVKSR